RGAGARPTARPPLAHPLLGVARAGLRVHRGGRGPPEERLSVPAPPISDARRPSRRTDSPHRHYVLVCTSDGRETFKPDDRPAFLRRCLEIAAGRGLLFKLHPDEDAERPTQEIRQGAQRGPVHAAGSPGEAIANCDVLVTEWSSTVFVGLALGKECYSNFDLAALRRLLPVQNGCAARNIAEVCRELLAAVPRGVPGEALAALSLSRAEIP